MKDRNFLSMLGRLQVYYMYCGTIDLTLTQGNEHQEELARMKNVLEVIEHHDKGPIQATGEGKLR